MWRPANNGFANTLVRALALDPTAPQTLYAGTFTNGAAKSIDGAATWHAANDGFTEPEVTALAVDPAMPSIVHAGTNSADTGVFRSADHGQSWSPSSMGLTDDRVRALAVDPTDSAVVYVGTTVGGVFKSADRGEHWSPMSGCRDLRQQHAGRRPRAGPTRPLRRVGRHPRRRLRQRRRRRQLAAGEQRPPRAPPPRRRRRPARFATPSSPGPAAPVCYETADGAASWRAANGGAGSQLETATVSDLAFAPDDPDTLYAATSLGVLVTRNRGMTWAGLTSGLFVRGINALAIDPVDPRRLYAASRGGGVFAMVLTALLCGNGTLDAGEAVRPRHAQRRCRFVLRHRLRVHLQRTLHAHSDARAQRDRRALWHASDHLCGRLRRRRTGGDQRARPRRDHCARVGGGDGVRVAGCRFQRRGGGQRADPGGKQRAGRVRLIVPSP